MTMKKNDIIRALKASAAKAREEEIREHGKIISMRTTVTDDRSKFKRSRTKAETRRETEGLD